MEVFVDGLKVLSSGSLIVDSEQKISFKIGSMTFVDSWTGWTILDDIR